MIQSPKSVYKNVVVHHGDWNLSDSNSILQLSSTVMFRKIYILDVQFVKINFILSKF